MRSLTESNLREHSESTLTLISLPCRTTNMHREIMFQQCKQDHDFKTKLRSSPELTFFVCNDENTSRKTML